MAQGPEGFLENGTELSQEPGTGGAKVCSGKTRYVPGTEKCPVKLRKEPAGGRQAGTGKGRVQGLPRTSPRDPRESGMVQEPGRSKTTIFHHLRGQSRASLSLRSEDRQGGLGDQPCDLLG